jgi:hypothetical protein
MQSQWRNGRRWWAVLGAAAVAVLAVAPIGAANAGTKPAPID